MIANVNNQFQLLPFMICLAVIVIGVAFAIGMALVWDKEPWWRQTPKPSRVYKNAKDQIRIYKLMQKHPDAFKDFHPDVMKEELK